MKKIKLAILAVLTIATMMFIASCKKKSPEPIYHPTEIDYEITFNHNSEQGYVILRHNGTIQSFHDSTKLPQSITIEKTDTIEVHVDNITNTKIYCEIFVNGEEDSFYKKVYQNDSTRIIGSYTPNK